MATRIAINCLNCGHSSSLAEEKLPHFGLEPNASLVTLTRRLVCSECGSKAVQTRRYQTDAPPLVPGDWAAFFSRRTPLNFFSPFFNMNFRQSCPTWSRRG